MKFILFCGVLAIVGIAIYLLEDKNTPPPAVPVRMRYFPPNIFAVQGKILAT